ncbi:MBL fold metallo-hydrolase [Roseomonas marmotae]|uniref:MBL fold metallo-hydrolase n=1 Tax=Roseomonas marmotae TaxID=2768161 RepID=A0ABS3K9Q7_9PROT|nr:MBL fold metallo-hydrolase [Roseomonas marmotae]MBO1074182.1 MBL fold metallo-hydrolase [Roseomonas marmotae]QTI78956.1 MBL fold metallo-hydrolase [Roseomonas marmotae]
MSIPFLKQDSLPAGVVEELGVAGGPRIRRIRCDNPGAFTFLGTNSYLLGEGEVALIDPGPEDAAHHAALQAALPGERITRILVTHTHRDHTGGVPGLRAATGASTFAFGAHLTPPAEGGEGADHDFQPDHRLGDDAVLEGEGWRLRALHTPGHCANHLCLALEDTGILFSGDHAMSCSTSVVMPPDGDMAAYMAALARIAAMDWSLMLAGHGAPLAEPGPLLRALLAHRGEREALVMAALRRHGPATAEALVPPVYGPLDPRLVRAAGQSLRAHLLKLRAEGQAAQDEAGVWRPVPG